MIQLTNITKTYGSQAVLQGISLRIPRGAYAALTGASGSGKSTLMNIIGCLDVPSEGRYLLDGQEVSHLSPGDLCRVRREKIGFVFQGYQLMGRLSAAENAAFPLLLRGVPEAQAMAAARRALARVGLEGRQDHRPGQLSGGQQQRVALARALCVRPRLLLCDEPTGALDPQSRDEILCLLEDWHRAGNTVLVITHDPLVASRATLRCHMQGGKLRME